MRGGLLEEISMLEKVRGRISGWLIDFRKAGFAGKVTLIMGVLIVVCLLCGLVMLAH